MVRVGVGVGVGARVRAEMGPTCRAAIAAPCCSETPAESPSLSPPPRRLSARRPASRTCSGAEACGAGGREG